MEENYAAIWGSIDSRSDESEMIAHLQFMFWSNSDSTAVNLCSPNTSVSSCVTACAGPSSITFPLVDDECYGAAPLVETGIDLCLDQQEQHQNITTTSRVITGDKRIFHMDEQGGKNKNARKKIRTIPSDSWTLGSGGTDEETNANLLNQSCTSYCRSDDESIGTFEKSNVLKQNDISRACKRSSNMSQSLYAKKRREKINERLKVLQQLIPNGCKVDISTMLEEAVQYVKFLQLQIKLLSSDETWMYAPLAYNGMNIGLSLSTPANQE